jgi:drug/metabolite transporter (DMT)-like permease
VIDDPAVPEPVAPAATRPARDAGALVAMGVTVTAWASAFVAIRWVGRSFRPGPLALGRLAVGAAVLGALLLARRTRSPAAWVRPTWREWRLLALCGLVWFATYNVALNAAERRVDAGTSAMLVNVGPVLLALLAGALLREGFPRWLLAGAAVAFAGAVLVGLASAHAARADGAGVLLCLLAAVGYAVGVLAQKPVLRRLPALQVTWLACCAGAVCCLPAVPQLVHDVAHAGAGPLAGLLYLGLVPTSLAFSTWAYALARMDAGRLGVTTYLVPPLVVLMGWFLLDEVPPALAVVGGVVCLAGVAVSRRRSRPRSPEPVPQEAAATS